MVMISKKYALSKKWNNNSKKSEESEESEESEKKVAKDLDLETYGWSSGFYQRDPKKITVTSLVLGFWKMQDATEHSLAKWALHSGIEIGDTITKEGINNRLSESAVEMVKMILKYALSLKLDDFFAQEKADKSNQKLYAKFNRILIQDSTMQKLPPGLSEIFKSSHSKKEAATLRLQATYDFTNEKWVDFELGGYTDNDQSKAMSITKVAQKDDLILRDLGYFTLESLAHLTEHQYVITKWSKTTNLYAPQSGTQINLLDLFKGKRTLDRAVHVGSKARLPLRLVAKKLPKEIAEKRVEEAKNDRHSKANHSEEYYKLLHWEIYLTNIEQSIIGIEEVAKLYGLRWYIEILFKAWKSYANFKTILDKDRMTYERTVISIYLMLIRFVYYMLDIYEYIKLKVGKKTDKLISIFKFFSICRNLSASIINIRYLWELDPLIPQFVLHGTYERRNKRKNMQQKHLYVKELCILKKLT